MTTTSLKRFLTVLSCLASFCLAFGPSFSAAAAEGPDVPSDSGYVNDGVWEGLMPPPPPPTRQEPVWSLRTGFRKGVHDQSLPDEVFAGPDAAVLRNGAFTQWTSLLAAYQESYALVGPDGIAALSRTKPYLVIPSGGLAGLASSAFFRAGLAEYVRTGGVVLCFAQQKGADLSALPVPEGSVPAVTGAGWTEDSGPLFRSSIVQAVHPILTGLRRTSPYVETDGYLVALPREATVLLRRQDGFPTLALYSFGSGRVVVSTLISDRSYALGLLDEEERTLLRDLVLWAKAGGKPAILEPGGQLDVQLALPGPEKAPASSVRVTVTTPSREKPLDDRTVPLFINILQTAVLPYSTTVPAGIAPGIYHLEYALLDGRRVLSPLAESQAGWFAVLPKTSTPPAVSRAEQPLAHPGLRITAAPRIELMADNRSRLHIDVTRTAAGGPPTADLLARAAGQEIYFKVGKDRGTVAIDLPAAQEGQPLSYAVYEAGGRALVKGSVPAALFKRTGVIPDKAWYLPGQTVGVRVSGLGSGSLRLSGLGSEKEQMLTRDAVINIPVPPALPPGTYSIAWTLESISGSLREGSFPVDVAGTTFSCSGAVVAPAKEGKPGPAAVVFSLAAGGDQHGTVRMEIEGPGGKKMPLLEAPFAAAKGTREAAIPVAFAPDQAGIWRLRYTFLAPLPEGPGFEGRQLTLAAGTLFVDAGDAAVLDVRTDPPLTYAPASAAGITAVAAGTSGAAFDILFDGRRIARDKIGKSGIAALTAAVKDVSQGAHTVRAAVTGRKLPSVRETRFLSGALLPDLAVSIKTSDIKAPALEVGVGITNLGRAASPATEAALYDGDPHAGGKLIRSFPVPQLDPGKQHVAIIPWPLAGKAGTRSLVAVIDEDNKVLETSRDNDRASFVVEIPDVYLSVASLKAEYSSDEPVDYRARVANFTAAPLKAPSLQFQTTGPTGRVLNTETVALADLAPGADQVIDRVLSVPSPPEGTYLVGARLSAAGKPLADDSRGIVVRPTLLLKGSLEGTPSTAAPCRPLEIRTAARNAGNIPATAGSLRLEIRPKGTGQSVYTRQLPFVLESRTTRIERVDLPRGDYMIILLGSAANKQRGQTGDFVLAEQPLTVADAVTVKRSLADFPRVLVWTGGDQSTTIERALIEKMAKEAFADDEAYLTVVASADDFTSQALTGMFNDYLLIDINETLGADDALRNALLKGQGVVIAGSGDRSRLMAETFGFRFDALPGSGSASITIPAGSGFGLTGTLPVSGATLQPRRKNARTVATFADGRPAILLDTVERGRFMVLPFSLTRSALTSGISTVYSRLLREAVLATMPLSGEQGDVAPVVLTVSSTAGPVQARLVEDLPSGAAMLWSNVKRAPRTTAPTFEVTVDSDPKTILYFFRPGPSGVRKSATAVFSACGGNFVSQGKVE